MMRRIPQVTLVSLFRLQLLVAFLVRRLSREIEEDDALLYLDLIFGIARLGGALVIFLCHELDLDAVDSTNQLGFEHRLAFLLAAFETGAWTAAVDAGGYWDAVDFVRFVTVD